MKKKTVLILSFSDVSCDSRVTRQIRALKEGYRIIALGYGEFKTEGDGVEFIPLQEPSKSLFQQTTMSLRLLSRRYQGYYWNQKQVQETSHLLRQIQPDLIIAHDIETLPVALQGQKQAKVFFDTQEYAPCEGRYKTSLCQRYLKQTDQMTTSCRGLADAYAKAFGMNPQVITNAPYRVELTPTPILRPDRIHMVCHAVAAPSRRLELLTEMMDRLEARFVLDLILIPVKGEERYYRKIEKQAERCPRIRIKPPVPESEMVTYLNSYDMGVCLVPPTNFNTLHALPRKLFEFIQARLAIAIGPSPEMARIVKKFACGVVGDTFSPKHLAHAINVLRVEQIAEMKQQAHCAAEVLCAENSGKRLVDMVRSMD